MTIADHLDALGVYQSMAVRVVPAEGEPEDLMSEGGGLAEAFDRHGRAPLVGVLRDARIQQVLLADGELTVEANRVSSDRATLSVTWSDAPPVNETVSIPPAPLAAEGPVFRPDPATQIDDLAAALAAVEQPLFAVRDLGGEVKWFGGGVHGAGVGASQLRGYVPALPPESLGSESFRRDHGVRWAYVAGAMAGGIASAALVRSMAEAGLLGFFGAGGLPVPAVKEALESLRDLPGAWGANLLHNPNEPSVEQATVDLYLEYGVTKVSASAFMGLTPAIVRYRLTGIRREGEQIVCPNAVFAKVSRPEVAEHFLRPAPEKMVAELVAEGVLTAEQGELAKHVPMATDITAEGDSGGHTDHRPLVVLLPLLLAQRDRIAAEQGYATAPRIGAAGGLGTPHALWSAFAMGADYVLTGSVNQSALEAGTSQLAKELLAEAAFTDVTSAPAPDMFEIGAHVQVLSRGAMYGSRAQKLYDLYRAYGSMDEIPKKERKKVEKQIFRRDLDEVWEGTRAYWAERDPAQVERAEKDGRHKMALTFRWYLGMTSRWARIGEADRKRDYQIWCGPSMGGFNAWVAGSHLAPLSARTGPGIAAALMRGAAGLARVSHARAQGLAVPATTAVAVP